MKRISNLSELQNVLEKESFDWQRRVYDAIGVYVRPENGWGGKWALFSACGVGSLTEEVEDIYRNGKDLTEFLTINSINELISYISEMDVYNKVLKDICIGKFYKKELYAAIWNQFLLQNLEHIFSETSLDPVVLLKRIETEQQEGKTTLNLCMDYNGVDSLEGLYFDVTDSMPLTEAVALFESVFKETWQLVLERELSDLIVDYDVKYVVPNSLDDLLKEVRRLFAVA